MKLTDIPKHITEISPPYFFRTFYAKYGISVDDFMDIKPLFHISYWDGPESGIIECKGHYFYAKCLYERERTFWACWELTDKQKETIFNRHKLFQDNVGTHTDYHYNEEKEMWVRNIGETRPEENWAKFYKNPDVPEQDYGEITSGDIFAILHNPFRSW